jgi:hypothetical protein
MNGGGTETLANFGNNGSVDLYYDNAKAVNHSHWNRHYWHSHDGWADC